MPLVDRDRRAGGDGLQDPDHALLRNADAAAGRGIGASPAVQEDRVARIGRTGSVVAQIQQVVVDDRIVDQMLILGIVRFRVLAFVDQGVVALAVGTRRAPVHVVRDLGVGDEAAGVVVDAVGLADGP